METATNPNTFGLASRMRAIFYPICVLPQDNRSQADDRPGIGPAISTAHGCRNRQCEAFQRGQDFGVWLGLIRSTVFDGWFVSDATTRTHVGRVIAKTGSRDRTQAVVLAYQSGLMS